MALLSSSGRSSHDRSRTPRLVDGASTDSYIAGSLETAAAPTFLAVVFDSAAAAEEALPAVRAVDAQDDVSVRDAAVVMRTDGGLVELRQTRQLAAGETIVGAGTVGLAAGLLLGLPVVAALVGLAGGAVLGLRDTGIPDGRLRALGDDLTPGQALLCVLVDVGGVEPAREALQRYGTVVEVALSAGGDP
jgi:uncharacterized membrane protein